MYLIFGGEGFYASGGGNDYLDRREDKIEAMRLAKTLIGELTVGMDEPRDDGESEQKMTVEWVHVVDSSTMEIVFESETKPYGA
jgi:hypothetical protein